MPSAIQPDRPPATGIKRHIPNLLVVARLVMTAIMIAVLSIYRFPDTNAWALPLATALFIIAAVTDALDGYLARKWNAVSVFGRIMDPTADKILVLGAFVMLAGPNFTLGWPSEQPTLTFSGFAPWMVVVILSRELLVTAMRGALESSGVDFSASMAGKAKMVSQSLAIPLIMLLLIIFEHRIYYFAPPPDPRMEYLPMWTIRTIEIIAWVTTLITALSAIPYITRARAAFKSTS